jgi:nitroreductase
VFVVTGERLERIRAAYRQRADARVERHFEIARPCPDWPPELAARTKALMDARAAVSDEGGGAPASADFFGAPCLLLFAIDARLQPEYACFDTGVLVQTVCLAAQARGLGTCIMASAVAYPDVLHELLPGADGRRFVVGVALGVPDHASPVNRFCRPRAPLGELATFVS